MNKRLRSILKYILFFGIGVFLVWWQFHKMTPAGLRKFKSALSDANYWLIIPVSYRPSFAFTGQGCFAFSGCLNGNPIKNIGIDPNQVSVAEICRLGCEKFLELLGHGVDTIARRKPHINLILRLIWNSPDLKQLSFVALGRICRRLV